MEADFQQLATQFGATRSMLRVPQVDARRRMGILVSQFDHCLTELLHRWEGGELDVDLTCVIRRVSARCVAPSPTAELTRLPAPRFAATISVSETRMSAGFWNGTACRCTMCPPAGLLRKGRCAAMSRRCSRWCTAAIFWCLPAICRCCLVRF